MPPVAKTTEQKPIQVKLLRASTGKVIFLESGSDFVELMLSIMNAPLSSLLPHQSEVGETNDLHPLVALKTSLSTLGSSSFIPGKRSAAIPKSLAIDQLLPAPKNLVSYQEYQPNRSWTSPAYQAACPADLLCSGCSEWMEGSAVVDGYVQCYHCGCSTQVPRSAETTKAAQAAQAKLARAAQASAAQAKGARPILKDNCKFMVTDSLQVLESSTITAMELLQEHANDFSGIRTSSQTVTAENVLQLVLCSMSGSRDVLTQIFPDADASGAAPSVSDGSFEEVDFPTRQEGPEF